MGSVKISDVAREAGVSLGTVSNALNHPDKVSPATLERINDAIAKLGYVPNQGARQLAGGAARAFGLVLPRLDHGFSLQIANGALEEAHTREFDLLIACAGNDDILENHYTRYLLGAQTAGVLVQPMASNSWVPPLQSSSTPTVFLDVHGDSPGAYVAADNEAQGKLMMEHAAECGAGHVAIVGKAEFVQLSLRIRGMCQVARQRGIAVELIGEGDWNTAADGYAIGRELAGRERGHRPDFVIALTDVLAAGAIDGICGAGLRVPEDILVAGCDGNPLAWSGPVPLTTVTSPGYEIGRRGVRLLFAQLDGAKLETVHQELVASSLLVRASTATSEKRQEHTDVPGLNLGDYL